MFLRIIAGKSAKCCGFCWPIPKGTAFLSRSPSVRRMLCSTRLLDHAVRVHNELLGGSFVKVLVTAGCLVERNHLDVYSLGGMRLLVQNCLHQLTVIAHYGTLACRQCMRLGPAETDTNPKTPNLGILVNAARIVCNIQSGDADRSTCACHFHEGIQHSRRPLNTRVMAMTSGFKADAVDGVIDFGNADDLSDPVAERCVPFQIDSFTTESLSLRQTLVDHVTNNHNGGSEQVARCRTAESDRSCPGYVNNRARADARSYGSVITRGKDVRKQCQIPDLCHRLIFVGEFEEVEIGVRDHDILRLPSDPAAHIYVAIRGSGAGRIDVQANARFSFLAVTATAACDVEGHRAEVANFDELYIAAGFDDQTSYLVTENQT